MHGLAQKNFRKPIKESLDFRPSWQARLGTHSRQDTEDEGIARLKPRHESAKTPFRNDLLARDGLLNQLRYRQLRIHLPVKRVEIHTGNQKYGTAGSASICNSGDTHENDIDLSRGSKRRRSSHTWPYGRDNGKTRTHSTIDNSTCAIVVRSVVNIQDSCQCRLCSNPASSRPGPADRYAPSGLPFPPLRGGPLLV